MAGQRRKASFDLDDRQFKAALKVRMKMIDVASARELRALALKTKNDAQEYTPTDTGRLKTGWYVETGKDEQGPWADVGNTVEYTKEVEYGTRPHVIRAKNKKVLANTKTGEVFGPVVNHPGTSPQPMLRPALIENARTWKPKNITD